MARPDRIGPGPTSGSVIRTTTSGGVPLEISRMARHERRVLQAVFDGLSARSRLNRYLVPMTRLPAHVATHLMDLDDGRHVAWQACLAGSPVGIARYLRLGQRSAELAVEVVDSVQRRGIGTALATVAIDAARRAGFDRLDVAVRGENRAAADALRTRGIVLTSDTGVLTGHICVVPERSWTQDG